MTAKKGEVGMMKMIIFGVIGIMIVGLLALNPTIMELIAEKLPRIIPGFDANQTPAKAPSILRYSIEDDWMSYYDGINWNDFDKSGPDGWNKLIRIGDFKVAGGPLRVQIEDFYYGSENSCDGCITISNNLWKSIYPEQGIIPEKITAIEKDLMQQTVSVELLFPKIDPFGNPIKETMTVKEAIKNNLNEDLPGDRLSNALNGLTSQTMECLILFRDYSSPGGFKFDESPSNTDIEAEVELMNKYPDLPQLKRTTVDFERGTIDYLYYYGTCPSSIVKQSEYAPMGLMVRDCEPFPAEVKTTVQRRIKTIIDGERFAYVELELFAKYAEKTQNEILGEMEPGAHASFELTSDGVLRFFNVKVRGTYPLDPARSCMLTYNKDIPPTNQIYKTLVPQMISFRDSVLGAPIPLTGLTGGTPTVINFETGRPIETRWYCLEKTTAQDKPYLFMDLSKPVSASTTCQ
ncbi:MAG: hypothetical protein ABH864_07375 [archaeon]